MKPISIKPSREVKSLRSPLTKSVNTHVLTQMRDANGHFIPQGGGERNKKPKRRRTRDEEREELRTPAPSLTPHGQRAAAAHPKPVGEVYLSIDAGKPQFLATAKEWDAVQRWARKLEPSSLVQLIEHGVHENPEKCFAQLKDAVGKLKEIPPVLKRFGKLLKQGGKVVTLVNGRPESKSLRSSLTKSRQFDESKVHRGQPENAGQFGPGGGGGGGGSQQQSPGRGASPAIVGQHGGPRDQYGTGANVPKGPQQQGQEKPQRDQAWVRQKVGERMDKIGQLSVEDIATHGAKAGIPPEVLQGDKATVMQNLKTWVETGDLPAKSSVNDADVLAIKDLADEYNFDTYDRKHVDDTVKRTTSGKTLEQIQDIADKAGVGEHVRGATSPDDATRKLSSHLQSLYGGGGTDHPKDVAAKFLADNPHPGKRPDFVPGIGNPKMKEKNPELQAAADKWHSYGDAEARHTMAKVVNEYSSTKPVKMPKIDDGDSIGRRVSKFDRAVDEASGLKTHNDWFDQFKSHLDGMASSHQQGASVVQSARAEVQRRLAEATAHVEAMMPHLSGANERVQRVARGKIAMLKGETPHNSIPTPLRSS